MWKTRPPQGKMERMSETYGRPKRPRSCGRCGLKDPDQVEDVA